MAGHAVELRLYPDTNAAPPGAPADAPHLSALHGRSQGVATAVGFATTLLLGACIENGLVGGKPDDAGNPGDDTDQPHVDTGDAPPVEECNGVDDDGDGLVDEGFPDTDGDGVADCVDDDCADVVVARAGSVPIDPACYREPTVPDAWDVVLRWTFEAPSNDRGAVNSYTQPVVADLDGDGLPEVAFTAFDFGSSSSAALVVLDGATGAEDFLVRRVSVGGQIALADADGDGRTDILYYDEHDEPAMADGDGTPRWSSDVALDRYSELRAMTVADLDGDGVPEVIADTWVLDGATGVGRAHLRIDAGAVHRAPTVGDLDGDGAQEIVLAGLVFDPDGGVLWRTPSPSTDMVWSALVQADEDDDAEVLFLQEEFAVYDADGTELLTLPLHFPEGSAGAPCVGDFDGDGASEVAFAAGKALYLYEVDGWRVWQAEVLDLSSAAGCAGVDLDGDGALEVVYADEDALRILDGRTGVPRFVDAMFHESETLVDSPALADLDGDGSLEIVAVNSDGEDRTPWAAATWGHAASAWPAPTASWPTFDYDQCNVLPDGEVPAAPDRPWLRGNGVRTLRPDASPAGLPDLAVAFTDACFAECAEGRVRVSLQVWNEGVEDVPAGVELALYADDDHDLRWVAATTLPALRAGSGAEGTALDLEADEVGARGWVATVDEGDTVAECDEEDNRATWAETCP